MEEEGEGGGWPGLGHSWGRTRTLLCLHKLKAVVALGLLGRGRASLSASGLAGIPILQEGGAEA